MPRCWANLGFSPPCSTPNPGPEQVKLFAIQALAPASGADDEPSRNRCVRQQEAPQPLDVVRAAAKRCILVGFRNRGALVTLEKLDGALDHFESVAAPDGVVEI